MIYTNKLTQYLILNNIRPNFYFQNINTYHNIQFTPYRYIKNDSITLQLKIKQFDNDFYSIILNYLKIPLTYPILLTYIKNLEPYYLVMYYYGINFLFNEDYKYHYRIDENTFKFRFLQSILFNQDIDNIFKKELIDSYINHYPKDTKLYIEHMTHLFNELYYMKKQVFIEQDKNSFYNYWIEPFIKFLNEDNIIYLNDCTFIYDVPLDIFSKIDLNIINSYYIPLPFILKISYLKDISKTIDEIFWNSPPKRKLILQHANLSIDTKLRYESIMLMDRMSHF